MTQEIDNSLMNNKLFREAFTHPDNKEVLVYFLRVYTELDEKIIRNNLAVKKSDDLTEGIIVIFEGYKILINVYPEFNNDLADKSSRVAAAAFADELERCRFQENLTKVFQINFVRKDATGKLKRLKNEYILGNKKNPKDALFGDEFKIIFYNLEHLADLK